MIDVGNSLGWLRLGKSPGGKHDMSIYYLTRNSKNKLNNYEAEGERAICIMKINNLMSSRQNHEAEFPVVVLRMGWARTPRLIDLVAAELVLLLLVSL